MSPPRRASRTRVHFKLRGQPFGIYTWSRAYPAPAGGIVVRWFSKGHIQLQHFRCVQVGLKKDLRRGKHGLKFSWWGVNGRRRKKAIEISVHL